VALLLAGAGMSLAAWMRLEAAGADRELRAARLERAAAEERLGGSLRQAVAAREHSGVHRELVARGIVGAERRLEWSEALQQAGATRRIADLQYRIEPRRALRSAGVVPQRVAAFASTLAFQATVLHEGEVLALLDDLRRAGNAWHAPRRCAIRRNAPNAAGSTAARLRAECEIELITVELRGAPS
jgi:hypothetical protein